MTAAEDAEDDSRADDVVRDLVEAWEFAELRGRQSAVLWAALEELAAISAKTEGRAHPKTAAWGPDALSDHERYALWVLQEGTRAGRAEKTLALPSVDHAPTISVVVPLYHPDLDLLERALGSVEAQTYGGWELCCCDDGSNSDELTDFLERFQQRHPGRVRWTAIAKNQGISTATNTALTLASGSWVAFLDQDDELAPEALEVVAEAIAADDEVDLVYTDDDKIDRVGRRFGPQFKPDWAPELLLSMCYFSHLVVARRSLVEEVGGLRSEFDGSQDYDLWLRVSEKCRKIRHISRVLYHWRAIPGSAALSAEAKPWAYVAGKRALEDTLRRRGVTGEVVPHPKYPGIYRVKPAVQGRPLVSVIVPFRDRAALLQRCIEHTVARAGHEPLEVVLVDNGSSEPETEALLRRLTSDPRIRAVRDPGVFNWSRLVNLGAKEAAGSFLLFLNNDIIEASQGWLAEMLGHAQRPEIGAVGAKLCYPDGRLQHVGMVLGVNGLAGHVLRGLPADQPGYLGYGVAIRNWSAVTGACLLTRRSVFEEAGGLDESLAVGFNDVDYCLRIASLGYRILCVPEARLVHVESSSRGLGGAEEDLARFAERWGERVLQPDPLYHPVLSRFDLSYVLARSEEEEQWSRLLKRLEQHSTSTEAIGNGKVVAGGPSPCRARPPVSRLP
ncbi:glycosyltransferase family 2 protein [Aciditerrimonas ferrireducens]|uniref:glycosyltransferase family 2 protein n=1 Tax=Aciditerrimonas ferrireducens TaxID=667306 RepID=UPI00200450A0|nr:glycosyltransferase family 2 protein [Aciditerrimonas ferrireducens]MCK4176074.1 glycosyltransferase family 2 protein [Aciditerrimonas ferrireducens]